MNKKNKELAEIVIKGMSSQEVFSKMNKYWEKNIKIDIIISYIAMFVAILVTFFITKYQKPLTFANF